MPLPRCFFDISINGIPTGRIIFELFTDICPKTCQNFKCLCTGEKGEGKTTFKPLHYKGTPIHRIVKGFIIQGGDFENGDGSGGESVYGGLFKDENFKLKHEGPFLLSMANKGPNTNGSQYFITTRAAPHLDGIHVVFGRVVSGTEFVTEMENQKVDSKSAPYADIRVTNCGELVLLKRGKAVKSKSRKVETSPSESEDSSTEDDSSSSSSSSSGTSEEERRRKKRKRSSRKKKEKARKQKKEQKRKKTRRKRKKRKDNESSGSSGEESTQEVVVSSTIAEEELPPEISTDRKSWLYRYSKSPSPLDGEKKMKAKKTSEQKVPESRQVVSSSGRTLKGRGNMRYRTPPPYSRGSVFRQRSPNQYQYVDSRGRSPERSSYRKRERSPDRNHSSPNRTRRHRSGSRDKDRRYRKSPARDPNCDTSSDRNQHRLGSADRQTPDREHSRSRSREHRHRGSPDRDHRHRRSPDRDHRHRRSPDRDHRHRRSPDRDHRHRGSPDRDHHHRRSPDRNHRHRGSPDRDHRHRRSQDRESHHRGSPDRDHRHHGSPDRDHRHRRSRDRESRDRDRDHHSLHGSKIKSPIQQSSASDGITAVVDRETMLQTTTAGAEEEEEDMTPPLYGFKEYWTNDKDNTDSDQKRSRLDSDVSNKPSSRWDVAAGSDEDKELWKVLVKKLKRLWQNSSLG